MSPLLLTLGSVMLLAAQNDTHASRPIWVDVPAQIGCPDESALLIALRARLGSERVRVGRASEQDPGLRLVERGPRALTLVLREDGATIVERNLEVATGECLALAHTLALIAESWLTAPQPRPRTKSRAAAPEQPKPVPSSPERTATAATPATVPAEEATPTPPSATPPGAVDTPVAVPPAVPAATVPTAAVPATAASTSDSGKVAASTSRESSQAVVQPTSPARLQDRPWSIAIAASAGAMVPIEGSNAWTAAGRLDIQLRSGRWLSGTRGAFESTTDLQLTVGNAAAGTSASTTLPSTATIAVRYAPVGAYAGRVLVESHRLTLAALVGGGLDIVSARASGYSSNSTHTAINPMAFAGLRCEWRFSGRFGVVATSDVALDLHRYQYSVANVGPVARTPRARAGFTLGLAWHLR